MRSHVTLCLIAVAGLLAGCNQPAVTLKAPAFQSSENTIRDWNDVAKQIASGMTSLGLLPGTMQPGNQRPLHQQSRCSFESQAPD